MTAKPSPEQLRAVYDVMRLLREDDRERGVRPDATVRCHSCGRERAAAGAVTYPAGVYCNGCATDYEVLRLARLTPPLGAEPVTPR